jgi:hypothetical protein
LPTSGSNNNNDNNNNDNNPQPGHTHHKGNDLGQESTTETQNSTT